MLSNKPRLIPEGTPLIVCLCGSMRFANEFDAANRDFTARGYIVLAPSLPHSVQDDDPELKHQLNMLYRHKIRVADIVYLISPDGYIGDSTRKELDFARSWNKPIYNWRPRYDSDSQALRTLTRTPTLS